MNMTETTREFVEFLGLNPDVLTDSEAQGFAAVLFSGMCRAMHRGFEIEEVEQLCFGDALKTDVSCMAWRWLDETTDKGASVIMSRHLRANYPGILDSYPDALIIKHGEFLSTQWKHPAPFLDRKMAAATVKFHQNRAKTLATTGELESVIYA